MPSVPFVKILHPMATALLETVGKQVKEALPQITQALTVAGEQEEKQTSQNDGGENLLTINGGVEEVFELFHEQGWTDGFPIIPPTEFNVRAMLSQSVYSPDTTLGLLPPAMSPVTVDKLAVNAVMAGCVPEYFPLILAAVEGLLDEDLALYSPANHRQWSNSQNPLSQCGRKSVWTGGSRQRDHWTCHQTGFDQYRRRDTRHH
jgi:hypothetical protein